MEQSGDLSVLELGQSRWGSPASDGTASRVAPGLGGGEGPSGSGALAAAPNGTGVHPSGADVGAAAGLSALDEAGLSPMRVRSGPTASLALSSSLTASTLRGLREPLDDAARSGAAGVLRPGFVGLAPSPHAMLLTTGDADPIPEPPPSGAKVLGGGFRTDHDEADQPSVLATAAIDPGFYNEFMQGRLPRRRGHEEDDQLRLENWDMCRKYFFLGCVALPLLHFVNVVYFFREWWKGERNVVLQTYALSSCIVAMFWVLVAVIWFIVYQLLLRDKFKWLGIESVDLGPELI